ncbi:MAG: hypothetical protein WBR26_01485 [Candidatus Acidiferrum sp.]
MSMLCLPLCRWGVTDCGLKPQFEPVGGPEQEKLGLRLPGLREAGKIALPATFV